MPTATIPSDSRKGALRIDEAAAYVGLNRITLYRLVNRCEGPKVVRIGRRVLFRQSDLDAWIASKVVDGGSYVPVGGDDAKS